MKKRHSVLQNAQRAIAPVLRESTKVLLNAAAKRSHTSALEESDNQESYTMVQRHALHPTEELNHADAGFYHTTPTFFSSTSRVDWSVSVNGWSARNDAPTSHEQYKLGRKKRGWNLENQRLLIWLSGRFGAINIKESFIMRHQEFSNVLQPGNLSTVQFTKK